MDQKELAREIYKDLAVKVGTNNEVWLPTDYYEGAKGGWMSSNYEPEKIDERLRQCAKFAQNAADIFEAEQEK